MKEYEVLRETFNACSGKWELDRLFTREVCCEDPLELLRQWLSGEPPCLQISCPAPGTTLYTLGEREDQRYSFSEF